MTSNQKDLNRIRRKVGMVFQGFHLFSHMNVLDNITLAPVKLLGLPREEAEKKAEELLKMVGLESKEIHDARCPVRWTEAENRHRSLPCYGTGGHAF